MSLIKNRDGGENEGGKDMGRISWTKDQLYIFIDLCNEFMERSKGKSGATTSQRLPWKKIVEEFQKRTTKLWDKNKLKNKYDWVRSRWSLWKQLKAKETGLGWDHVKRTICADNEWWEKKIQENGNFKTFRDEGIEPELEYKLDLLFGYSIASGANKHTPGHLHTRVQIREEEAYVPSPPNNNNLNDRQHDTFANDSPIGYDINLDGSNDYNNSRADSAWEEIWREITPTSTPRFDNREAQTEEGGRGKRVIESDNIQTRKSARSESTRKNGGNDLIIDTLNDIMQSISRRNDSITTFFQSIGNAPASSENTGIMSITDALAKLCALKEFVPTSPEFCFAVSMMEDAEKREILANLPSDAAIIAWIKFQFERHGS